MKRKKELNKITVMYDMDGVLCLYTAKDFRDKAQTWKKPGYFQTLKPDKEIVKLFRALTHIKDRNTKSSFVKRVNVLTTILPEKPFNTYQHDDKVKWMDKYVFSKLGRKAKYYTKFTTHGLPKPKVAEKILGRKLTKNDILIDDYNPNLQEFQKAGGTAVKYINGLNSPESWDGPKLYKGTTTKQKVDYLYSLVN